MNSEAQIGSVSHSCTLRNQTHSDTTSGRVFNGEEYQENDNFGSDAAFQATIERLIDKSKVIELEKLDPAIAYSKPFYRFVKRVFDIISCSCALVVCAIPMAAIAIIIKVDSPGPVFYKQERLGLNGKPFTLVKFRSMRVGAESQGAQWASNQDDRMTKVGRVLRSTRLDEMPQFASVITGKLSLIGPRPERKVFYDEFEKYIHGFGQRLLVKPGITGLAQVNGGYDLLPEEKVLYDFEYIKGRSIILDAKVIAKTFQVLFSREGAR